MAQQRPDPAIRAGAEIMAMSAAMFCLEPETFEVFYASLHDAPSKPSRETVRAYLDFWMRQHDPMQLLAGVLAGADDPEQALASGLKLGEEMIRADQQKQNRRTP